ncbi:hypothetical protein C7999DRAFT_40356 [Corynascus novoguineensis]|uniref:Uncharacterized protein n=1 Tax=Corynascus novoguineensis TaxID=1126955 RepID=A0AAN7CX24_9PEZI|nr:hypothetical protein C7999DRAFT_40356 [Corynascus novoguineensis]
MRHALRSALGRAAPSTTARALSLPISTTTPASFFSTSSSLDSESSKSNNDSSSSSSSSSSSKPRKPRAQSAAVQRLAQLNNKTNSAGGLDEVPGGGIDARSLRVSPDVAAAAPGSGASGPRGPRKDSDKEITPGSGKLVWKPEEQVVLDRLDKGEVVPFDPKLTLDTLTGYGAAVATDAPIGQVETALRTMRLMTGGMAFNSDSGVTTDLKEVEKRYFYKQPIFVHSKGEKEWIESAFPKVHLVGPNEKTKKAIIEPAVLGKYEAPKFADVSDVKGTMANYHSRTFTYMSADSQKFMDKVLSLLPAQQGGKPAAQTQAKR